MTLSKVKGILLIIKLESQAEAWTVSIYCLIVSYLLLSLAGRGRHCRIDLLPLVSFLLLLFPSAWYSKSHHSRVWWEPFPMSDVIIGSKNSEDGGFGLHSNMELGSELVFSLPKRGQDLFAAKTGQGPAAFAALSPDQFRNASSRALVLRELPDGHLTNQQTWVYHWPLGDDSHFHKRLL